MQAKEMVKGKFKQAEKEKRKYLAGLRTKGKRI
jgi:hypothetical protein